MIISNRMIKVILTSLLTLLTINGSAFADNKEANNNTYIANNHSKSNNIDLENLKTTIEENKKLISTIDSNLKPEKPGQIATVSPQAKHIINNKVSSINSIEDKDLPQNPVKPVESESIILPQSPPAHRLTQTVDTVRYIMPDPQDDKFIHQVSLVTTTKNDPKLDKNIYPSSSSEAIYKLHGSDFKSKFLPFHTEPFTLDNKFEHTTLFKGEVSKTEGYYDEITMEAPMLFSNDIDDLNDILALKDPGQTIPPMIFKEKKDSPFVNRLKTVYFLTALSTCIGQSTQIQDAFTPGHHLTGGGTSLNDYYGYENIARNLLNPFSRAVKGAKVDDSGPIVNYIQHPFFGFGIASYLGASGASAKETILVTLADNFLFEYVVEGTYVAPSGIDFLATSGGCIAGFLASKYILKKPFRAFIKKTSALKAKYHVNFDPIIAPGYAGKGMKVGTRFTIKHK